MPKVLRIINRLNLGGPTYNAAYLTKYLEPEYETLLLAGEKDESEASSEFIVKNLGIKPIYIPEMKRSINLIQDRKAYKQIKSIIQDFKPDIVHTHAAKSGTLGRLAANACQVPVIIHTFHGHVFHSYFNPIKTRVFLEIERYLSKKSTKIIAISPQQKEDFTTRYNLCTPDKIEVIPLGFDLSKFMEKQDIKRQFFRKKYNISENEVAVGIIGRIVPIKNHAMFLRSLKNVLSTTDKNIRAFIIGDGENKNTIMNMAKGMDINFADATKSNNIAHLTFTSWIENIDVANAGLDIITLTSFNEGTPVSLIEAQAAAKPVVSTDIGGVCDIVIPNVTALLSESNDDSKFSNNLRMLVENEKKRKEMGAAGRTFVKYNFTYKLLINNMQSLYNKLLSQIDRPAY